MPIAPYQTVNRPLSASRAWLASLHGTDQTETITLDLTKFTAGTHYVVSTDPVQPYSRFLSGVPVGRITASGLYGPWTPAATDGTQALAGFVFAEAAFAPGDTKLPCALLWHGVVKVSACPVAVDPTKHTPSSQSAQIRFV
jgi:head decoration protein D